MEPNVPSVPEQSAPTTSTVTEATETPPFVVPRESVLGRLEAIASLRKRAEETTGVSKKIRTEGVPSDPKAAKIIETADKLMGVEGPMDRVMAQEVIEGSNAGKTFMTTLVSAPNTVQAAGIN